MNKSEELIIIDILSSAFKDNLSTNFVIKQDSKKKIRLKTLIQYSIFYGQNFGKIYLSEDLSSCAIILNPKSKKITASTIIWDIRLIFKCIGLKNAYKVLKRESLIKSYHPKSDYLHLWYIGVSSNQQGNGLGTKLMKEILNDAKSLGKSIYLETSTVKNFKFYERLGFEEVTTINQLGYSLKMYKF